MNGSRIEDCYRALYEGMINKNCDILTWILDDTFILIHMTGMKQSKKSFIEAVSNGTLNYYAADHQGIGIKSQGDSVELIGKSLVEAAVFGGNKNIWRLQLTLKMIQKDDAWKITEAKASTY